MSVDTLRLSSNLGPYPYTDPILVAGVTSIRAVHITELRAALGEAYNQYGLTPPTYTDPMLTGIAVKAVHITELRNAAIGLEGAP